jgi:hypothetical protein
MALGLLMGTKYSGLGYALLIGIAHIVLSVARRKTRRLTADLLVLTGVALLVGGFWYARNWIDMGNPLAPVAVRLAGYTLFPGQATLLGVVPQESTLLAHIFDSGALWLFIERGLLEKGGIATALVIPALLFATLEWGYRVVACKEQQLLDLVLYILLPWGAFCLLLVTPLGAENAPGTLNQLQFGYSPIRYGFPFWALGGLVLVKWLADEHWRGSSWLLEIMAVLAIAHGWVTMLRHQWEFSSPALSALDLVAWIGLLAGALIVECLWRTSPRQVWHWPALALAAAITVGFVLWPAYLASFSARVRLYDYKWPGYAAFSQQVKEQGVERVHVVGYPGISAVFAGEGLTTRVIHCHGSVGQWMDCLDKNKVELVAFDRDPQTMTAPINEDAIMQQYARRFVRVFSDKHIRVYRVTP